MAATVATPAEVQAVQEFNSELRLVGRKGMAAAKIQWARSHYPEVLPDTDSQLQAVPYPHPNSVRYFALALRAQGGRTPEGSTFLPHADLVRIAAEATAQIQELCTGSRWYVNPAETLHVSLFHTGRPDEPRVLSKAAIQEEIDTCRLLFGLLPCVELTVDVRISSRVPLPQH
eukprot:scaffold2761_cov391-Prasinococcus_capsulatus_cf.AAC.7